MANNMDIDASGILKGESLSSVGEQIFNKIVQISNGMPTEAERRGLEEFAINEIQQNELR
jgi:Altronate dehydratase